MEILINLFKQYNLVAAFMITAFLILISNFITGKLGQKRMASAFAIVLGLALAYYAGSITGGKKGIADIAAFSGFGLLGGGMLRDYTIISTAYGVKIEDLKKSGLAGVISLLLGLLISFVVGVALAYAFGFRDAAELTTIGGGTATFIVGPVTGTALNVGSDIVAISVAAGVIKSILAMILTPLV
ncbi:hypothetical protein, partial [Cetobacterium sp.]